VWLKKSERAGSDNLRRLPEAESGFLRPFSQLWVLIEGEEMSAVGRQVEWHISKPVYGCFFPNLTSILARTKCCAKVAAADYSE
jgi:hypothetical protein